MDLRKEDRAYTPLSVDDVRGSLVEAWQAVGGTLDSAFHTSGGRYEWRYYGLVDEASGQAA